MKFIIIFASIFFTFLNISSAAVINCGCTDELWYVIGIVYTCDVLNDPKILSVSESTIDSMAAQHASGANDNDVIGISIRNKKVYYFPRRLSKFFKNTKGISIVSCGLKEVHQSDLQPFDKLRYLKLEDNNIEYLEEGLFSYNPDLELIHLSHNVIAQIHPNVFDQLTKLKTLYLLENTCINKYSFSDRTKALEVIQEVKNLCPPPEVQATTIKTIFPTTESPKTPSKCICSEEFESLEEKLTKKIQNLEEKLIKIMNSLNIDA